MLTITLQSPKPVSFSEYLKRRFIGKATKIEVWNGIEAGARNQKLVPFSELFLEWEALRHQYGLQRCKERDCNQVRGLYNSMSCLRWKA